MSSVSLLLSESLLLSDASLDSPNLGASSHPSSCVSLLSTCSSVNAIPAEEDANRLDETKARNTYDNPIEHIRHSGTRPNTRYASLCEGDVYKFSQPTLPSCDRHDMLMFERKQPSPEGRNDSPRRHKEKRNQHGPILHNMCWSPEPISSSHSSSQTQGSTNNKVDALQHDLAHIERALKRQFLFCWTGHGPRDPTVPCSLCRGTGHSAEPSATMPSRQPLRTHSEQHFVGSESRNIEEKVHTKRMTGSWEPRSDRGEDGHQTRSCSQQQRRDVSTQVSNPTTREDVWYRLIQMYRAQYRVLLDAYIEQQHRLRRVARRYRKTLREGLSPRHEGTGKISFTEHQRPNEYRKARHRHSKKKYAHPRQLETFHPSNRWLSEARWAEEGDDTLLWMHRHPATTPLRRHKPVPSTTPSATLRRPTGSTSRDPKPTRQQRTQCTNALREKSDVVAKAKLLDGKLTRQDGRGLVPSPQHRASSERKVARCISVSPQIQPVKDFARNVTLPVKNTEDQVFTNSREPVERNNSGVRSPWTINRSERPVAQYTAQDIEATLHKAQLFLRQSPYRYI